MAEENYGDINNVEYVRNYDGDTITFNIKQLHPIIGKEISVRVRGVDTPEIRGKCIEEKTLAKESKIAVKNELENAKKINLKNVDRGKYFRILADVKYDGKDLSSFLINNNFAVPYSGGTKSNQC